MRSNFDVTIRKHKELRRLTATMLLILIRSIVIYLYYVEIAHERGPSEPRPRAPRRPCSDGPPDVCAVTVATCNPARAHDNPAHEYAVLHTPDQQAV